MKPKQTPEILSKTVATGLKASTWKAFFALLFLPLIALATPPKSKDENNLLLQRLDRELAKRSEHKMRKEHSIDSLKARLHPRMSNVERLGIYNRLYEEYLTFNYDSTMRYVDRAADVASRLGGYDRMASVRIHKALSLATSGQFSQAVQLLDGVNAALLPDKLREEYYTACEWTYGVWGEYSEGSSYSDAFREKSLIYLDSLISVTAVNTPEYSYRLAERALREHDYEKARDLYLLALEHTPLNSRLYAQAAYALGIAYKELGDMNNYRKWLINAAISDQVTPLKENLALQQLAQLLTDEDGDIPRANRYLEYSLEDAIFYNNRLRMVEIAEKILQITSVYQEQIYAQNGRMRIYLGVIGLLAVGLAVAMIFAAIERRKLARSKDLVTEYNSQLSKLNEKLNATNRNREQYVSLFMDLCAAYIDKLNKYRQTVFLKLKARQYDDLQRLSDGRGRPSEAELREVFFNFDSAFLRLYPDFIEKFNALLRPGEGIYPKHGELLSPDLRIFAMIRMGITDSTKIATLLFYSPQTIFNRRTQVRNRALERNNFETQVAEIE